MRTRLTFVLSFVVLLAGSAVSPAVAQDSPWTVGVSGTVVQFDLSGTGNAPGLVVGASREVARNVVVEVRALFAALDQQFGTSTFFAPDVHVHYRWNLARLSPYVGGGLGISANPRPFRTDWDPTLSVAAGTGIRLAERMDLLGEFRLRSIEWRGAGSTAEWSAGLRWRLPSF